jgi:SnoaL-like domain
MTVAEIVGLYYDAWQARHGDFSAVPLADDFAFTGPVASFTDAAGYRAMVREAGPLVTRFSVRQQFTDGNRVCSIIDWEMALPVGQITLIPARANLQPATAAARTLKAQGGRLDLVNPQPALAHMLTLLGVDEILTVRGSTPGPGHSSPRRPA